MSTSEVSVLDILHVLVVVGNPLTLMDCVLATEDCPAIPKAGERVTRTCCVPAGMFDPKLLEEWLKRQVFLNRGEDSRDYHVVVFHGLMAQLIPSFRKPLKGVTRVHYLPEPPLPATRPSSMPPHLADDQPLAQV